MCNGMQFGILNSRYLCTRGHPDMFTKVFLFEKFIKNIIKRTPSKFKTSFKNNSNNFSGNLFISVSCLIFLFGTGKV